MATGAKVTSWRDQHKQLALTYARVFDYDFAILEEHRRQMDASLKAAIKAMDHRWIKIRDQVRDEDQLMAFTEEFHETSEMLPRLQWNAQLVLAYSTLEHSLNQICKLAQGRMGSTLTLENFQDGKKKKDSGIYRARAYLGQVAGIKKPFTFASWKFVDHVNKLRNVIVHTNGEFDDPPTEKQKSVQVLFKDDPRVRVIFGLEGNPQRFRLTPEFLHGAIHAMAQVVKDICESEPAAKNLI